MIEAYCVCPRCLTNDNLHSFRHYYVLCWECRWSSDSDQETWMVRTMDDARQQVIKFDAWRKTAEYAWQREKEPALIYIDPDNEMGYMEDEE